MTRSRRRLRQSLSQLRGALAVTVQHVGTFGISFPFAILFSWQELLENLGAEIDSAYEAGDNDCTYIYIYNCLHEDQDVDEDDDDDDDGIEHF